jgi:hypothetical protein
VEGAALKEILVPPQPAGPGPQLPKVYCIISCIGCFGLFSKVGLGQNSLEPVRQACSALLLAWQLALQLELLVECLPDSPASIKYIG